MPPVTDATATAPARLPRRLDLKHIFTYHAPKPEQIPLFHELRIAAYDFAQAIENLCPPGADTSAAIRHVREALMTANAAIALDGRLEVESSQVEVP